MHIGYFIPEFPGQTHIFLWRELGSLARMGVTCDLVSTRRPPAGLVSHDWAPAAADRTTYLFPPNAALVASSVLELLRAGPAGWWRVLREMQRADGVSAKRMLGLAFAGAELSSVARRHKWEHIHVHSCADAAHVAMFAHALHGRRYSLTLHGPLLEDYGPNQANKWRRATSAIVVSRPLYEHVQRVLAGALPPLVECAPMGLDLDVTRRNAPYAPWSGTGPARIFACGRVNPVKGHDTLIQAIARLRARGVDAVLEIAGGDDSGGAYRRTLEQLATDEGVREHVTFLGAVNEARIIDAHRQSHVFALNSHREGLPVAVMEAMAMSSPVVTTRIDGNTELVDDGTDGVLVPVSAPDATADAIERVLRDPALATRLGVAARAKVERTYGSDVNARAVVRGIEASRREARTPVLQPA